MFRNRVLWFQPPWILVKLPGQHGTPWVAVGAHEIEVSGVPVKIRPNSLRDYYGHLSAFETRLPDAIALQLAGLNADFIVLDY
jgi:hypothetical protein